MKNNKLYIGFLIVLVLLVKYIDFPEAVVGLFSSKSPNPNGLISKFIEIKGMDEFVVVKVDENEIKSEPWCKKVFGNCIPGTKTLAVFSVRASYKYYVNLAEIKYTMNDGQVSFNIPHLYLSKPVGFDSIKQDCNDSIFGNCSKLYTRFMAEFPSDLEKNGESKLSSVYTEAAKALADDFHEYFVNNYKGLAVKTISVKFSSEDTNNNHVFHYSDNVFKSPL